MDDFPFEPNQIVTVEDLIVLKPSFSREDMEDSIINYMDLNELYSLSERIIGERIEEPAEFERYLQSLSDEDIANLFHRIRCFGLSGEYKRTMTNASFDLRSEAIIKELLENGFNCVGFGTVRRVFDLGDWVLKVPYMSSYRIGEGVVENYREVKLYQNPRKSVPLMSPVIPLTYQDKSGHIHEGINLMRKVYVPSNISEAEKLWREAKEKYPDYAHWSFGYNDEDELRVYDFD